MTSESYASTSSVGTTKISFRLPVQAKKVETIQTSTKFVYSERQVEDDEEDTTASRKRNVICLENGIIKDDEPDKKKEKKEYCITLRKEYDWRIQKLRKLVEEGTATEEEKARLALMLESLGNHETANGGDKVINALNGDDADPTIGSALDADYDEIPVGEFGRAFLRGCGWKEGEGIGRTNKCVVPLKICEARPKGLGLGSHLPSKPSPSRSEKNGSKTEENVLKKGSYVKIVSGSSKDSHGKVRSLDEDNSSCFVELFADDGKPNGKVMRVSQFAVQIMPDISDKRKSSRKNV